MAHKFIESRGLRVLLLEDPATAARILRPLVAALVIGGITLGLLVDDDVTDGVSVVILLITSVIFRRILDVRRAPGAPMFSGPARIWALISLGFLFLAFDELLSIHERIDSFAHWVLSIKESGLTDRIDDMIILVYAIIGAILIYIHRSEFRLLGGHYRFLIIGFALVFVVVLTDALTNRGDVLQALGFDDSLRRMTVRSMKIVEEVSELLAEAVFLFGFLGIYRTIFEQRATSTGNSSGQN